jgi:hypothetical protein
MAKQSSSSDSSLPLPEGDQFFSESQFESYRMLGAYTMEKLCTNCDGDFRCFIADILKCHLQIEPPVWLAEIAVARNSTSDGLPIPG